MKTYTNPQFPGKVFRRLEVGDIVQEGDYYTEKPDDEWVLSVRVGETVDHWFSTDYYREIPHAAEHPTPPPPMDPDYIPNLAAELGIKTQIGQKALKLALENVQLLDRKQQDYGSQNIARHGEFGVLVRCDDKTARIANLLKKGQHKFDFSSVFPEPHCPAASALDEAQNESRLDSWLDMANYGLIGALVLKGEWQ
jgi:hypothetical protein